MKTVATPATAKKTTTTKTATSKKPRAKKVVAKTPVAKKRVTKKIVKATPTVVSEVKETSNEIKAVVTSTVKDISKKADFTKNVDKVRTSVKTLNDQIVASTSDIIEEVVEMNKEIADIAVKSVKEMATNFDMDQEVEKIKASAVELNEKVINRAKELNSQVVAKAEELKSTTAKLANDMLEIVNINERMATVKDAVLNSNKYAMEAANNAIDNVEKNTTEWQKIGEKAVKRSFKIASKQQDLVFDTLEEVKSQVLLTRKNIKNLFSSKEA